MKTGTFNKKTYAEICEINAIKSKNKQSIKSEAKVRTKGRILTTKRVSKPKSPSISTLKKKLWTVFSLYIRQRDNFTCFTCGRIGEGGGMHAGHFIPKSVGGINLYFDEDNVHAQCYHCNINLGGNQYEYSLRLGGKARELYEIKGVYHKWTVEDYKKKIEYYKTKVK